MSIMIGSARIDERGKHSGGVTGDQKQTSSVNDTVGEVSMQAMYTHSRGWYILRPKSVAHANAIAAKMKAACNNKNIGYDQGNRSGIITHGIATKVKTECDCGTLVRECIKEATGKDPGNFTTANEAAVIGATGLFETKVAYVSQAKTPVYNGDVLVTKTKGHTVIVVSGNPRSSASQEGEEYDMTQIRKGSKGNAVKIWQIIVGATVDGDFGSDTDAKTRTFQKNHGLTVDGIVGAKSWKAGLESV